MADDSQRMRCQHLSLAHYVLFGMFLGFGLSSVVLGIIVVINENHPQTAPVAQHRARRDVEEDLQYQEGPQVSYKGHIDIIANANVEEILADEIGVVDPVDTETTETKGGLYALLLGDKDTVREYSQAIQQTWGPELPHHQIIYWGKDENTRVSRATSREVGIKDVADGEAYGLQHLLESLHHACVHHADTYQWFVVAKQSVYINPAALLALTDRLSPTDPLLIGEPLAGQPSSCSLLSGSMLSREAMRRLCPRLSHCALHTHTDQPSALLGQCLYATSGLSCLDTNRLLPGLHVDSVDEVVSQHTALIGPTAGPHDHFTAHMRLASLRIHAMQHSIVIMQDRMTSGDGTQALMEDDEDDLDNRPKRESVWNESDDHIPFQSAFLNTSAAPFRQYVDYTGYTYRDTCHLYKSDITDMKTSYMAARHLADLSVEAGLSKDWSLAFGYRSEKAKVGVEYDFYYVESDDGTDRNHKVHQVMVQQLYDDVEVRQKEQHTIRDLTIITSIPDGYEDVEGYLDMVHTNCDKLKSIGRRTCSVLLYLYKNSTSPSPVRHSIVDGVISFKSLHPNFKLDYVEINQDITFSFLLSLVHSTVNNNILAFLPADARINFDFLLRCQLNTKLQEKAYFPVGLHVGDPSLPGRTLQAMDPDTTFWINRDFDTFCAYSSDIQDFQARIEQPRDVYSLFVWAGFDVNRAPDPALQRDMGGVCRRTSQGEERLCMEELKYMNMG